MDWVKEAERLRFDESLSWTELAKEMLRFFPEMSETQVLEKVRRRLRHSPIYKKNKSQEIEKIQRRYQSDGSVVSEKFVTLQEGEMLTPGQLLELHGLDPTKWEIVSCTDNFWNSQIKGGIKQISYQSKLTAKPIKDSIGLEDIDNYFSKKDFKISKPLAKGLNYHPDGEVLEICLPDLHSGLLAWRMETGADYDLHIVQERFYQCAYDIAERCKGRKFKKIILATLGDLLHFDNDNQTTTKGTFQQADGRLAKIFDFTLDMLINFITVLGDITKVEVIYLPGNHDRVVGYMLAKSAAMAFRNDDNITFDTMPETQKHRLIGNALIGWTHGDMQKQNMVNWLQHSARKDYGQSKFAEVHAGHFHSISTKETKRDFTQEDDVGGVIVRYLPTICNSSYWEHQQGYTSGSKTMMCFVWNEETGLREMWYSNVA